MNGDMKVIEYIKETAEIVKTAEGDVITAEQMLERFLFPRPMQTDVYQKAVGRGKAPSVLAECTDAGTECAVFR